MESSPFELEFESMFSAADHAPPFKKNAEPCWSTAAQKLTVGHDTLEKSAV